VLKYLTLIANLTNLSTNLFQLSWITTTLASCNPQALQYITAVVPYVPFPDFYDENPGWKALDALFSETHNARWPKLRRFKVNLAAEGGTDVDKCRDESGYETARVRSSLPDLARAGVLSVEIVDDSHYPKFQ